jgi:3-hydroxybutyryl-CoA dehydratase
VTEDNEKLRNLSFDKLEVGMEASITRTIETQDVKTFAELSGDTNPVHTDPEFAAKTQFQQPIVHGLHSATFFSAIFGTLLPGPGSVYISQSLQFKRPIYVGDTVTATVSIQSIDPEKRRIFFRTICRARQRVMINGEAEIYMPES